MKRRRFFQYVGFGGAGFALATHRYAFAFDSLPFAGDERSGLKSFQFAVTTVDQSGQIKQQQTHTARFFSEPLQAAAPLEMVAIAPGQFWMGASRAEAAAKGVELPRHRVNLPSFFVSKYSITQSQWAAVAALPKVIRDLNPEPSHFQGGDRPVESVSWLEAVEFCDRLSQHTGRRYHLPSEAQWEYACRAGTQTPFHTGETITHDLANYVSNYRYRAESPGKYHRATMPVGRFSPNAFGLYDMHGNVWEWCADSWHHTYHRAPGNGQPWVSAQSSQLRAIRGGGWLDAPANLRSASRSGYLETALNRTIGFRVVTT
ncbi:MAG: formylglycine-generating enzyme family protein [Synechococcales bacterium]|nr:formylglycine-generating enzyme family protein [Synechococcales bacterium]